MNPYEERTEREWFVKGRARNDIRRVENEHAARDMVEHSPASSDSVALYRDVTYGPMVEAER